MSEYTWGDSPNSPYRNNDYLFLEDESMNEHEQQQQALTITQQAQSLIVTTQQGYNNAAEVCKEIKATMKRIEDYWEKDKSSAYATWKGLCDKEKTLLAPFAKAEAEIKSKMTTFQRQLMEEQRIQREEQERFRKEEAERLMKAAEEAQQDGMAEHADYLVEEAAKVEVMRFEQPKQEKTAGTAVKKVWKARITNAALVPVSITGAVIRPIDEKVLNDLAKASKGNMAIPGVEFYEDVQIAVSRG
jgi:AAA15 family ATPase/GTPase